MSVSVTINTGFSGIGPTPMQASNVIAADNGLQMSEDCAANSTTTVSLPLIFDPDAKVQAAAFMVQAGGGDVTATAVLWWDATSGSDVTQTLTSGKPQIRDATTFGLANIPTSADTYTLKVVTGSVSMTFDGRLLFND